MSLELLPFILGFGLGLGCCIAALVVVLRALKPFQKRTTSLQAHIRSLNLEQARKDTVRLAHAAERIAILRDRVGGA